MVKIGDLLYDMRIVKNYNGQIYEERPLFNGFEGIVVWNTWDTGEWEVLRTWREKGEYQTEEIGYIDDGKVIGTVCKGEDVAKFIKEEINKICNNKVNEQKVGIELSRVGIIGTRDLPFNKIVGGLTQYINEQIDIALQRTKDQLNNFIPIAIDETIASIIQIHDER